MRNIPPEAAYLRETLKLGLVNVSDVVAWSDSVIGETETPSYLFIELSSMRSAHLLDVLGALQALSESISTLEVLPMVLDTAHEALSENPRLSRDLARALYQIYVEYGYETPEEIRDIGWFDDAFSLAGTGVYGDPVEVQNALLQFTGKFSERANQRLKPTWPKSRPSGLS